jgi:hypothetical protein
VKIITRILILLLLLFAAITCYAIGVPRGTMAFIILGFIFEGLFWIGLLGRKKNSKDIH